MFFSRLGCTCRGRGWVLGARRALPVTEACGGSHHVQGVLKRRQAGILGKACTVIARLPWPCSSASVLFSLPSLPSWLPPSFPVSSFPLPFLPFLLALSYLPSFLPSLFSFSSSFYPSFHPCMQPPVFASLQTNLVWFWMRKQAHYSTDEVGRGIINLN